jgi:energy-converting hydrogenase A subunit R
LNGVFVSDCEGPISKNDNAFELTAHFVPKGDILFSIISKYDDVLVDVLKKKGYNAGDTLKLVLPFLMAYNVTDDKMNEFSAQNLRLISGSIETLKHLMRFTQVFIVSTSYEHYIRVLCKAIGLPFENAYCTRLSIDQYKLTPEEEEKLRKIADEIVSMPMIIIPLSSTSIKDFSGRDQNSLKRLDEIFWKQIPQMSCGKIYSDITTVGGKQKADTIRHIIDKLCLPLSSLMYVGDSITDVEAFQLVRQNGGLTISFNGNNYAVRNAEIVVLSENNLVMAVFAEVFIKQGKARALQLAENWHLETLRNSSVDSLVLKRLLSLYPKGLPKLQIVTSENMKSLSAESSDYRKKVRGEAVGQLG